MKMKTDTESGLLPMKIDTKLFPPVFSEDSSSSRDIAATTATALQVATETNNPSMIGTLLMKLIPVLVILLTTVVISVSSLPPLASISAVHLQRQALHIQNNIQTFSKDPIVQNLAKGAFLRVFSDLTGVTVLENIKCRVAASKDGPIQATRALIHGDDNIHIRDRGGSHNSNVNFNSSRRNLLNLWSGTSSRTAEGTLSGALFLVGSTAAKRQVLAMGGGNSIAAFIGGITGGLAQAIIQTPSGMVVTSLNVNKGKPGYENDNTLSVTKRIVQEKGVLGMFIGMGPMSARQASNCASRCLFTEICRTNLKLARFGLIGEICSGVIGGVGSCWNTPIETVRILMQKDVSEGRPTKTFGGYITTLMDEGGVPALFRGVTPRCAQSVWQTIFMVAVPNLLGL